MAMFMSQEREQTMRVAISHCFCEELNVYRIHGIQTHTNAAKEQESADSQRTKTLDFTVSIRKSFGGWLQGP
jgi:hypothetical protein